MLIVVKRQVGFINKFLIFVFLIWHAKVCLHSQCTNVATQLLSKYYTSIGVIFLKKIFQQGILVAFI